MDWIKAPDKIAGLLSLLGAFLSLVSWYILLFVAMPDGISIIQSVVGQLRYTFSTENPAQLWFIGFAILPLGGIAIGLCYLANLAKSKAGAVILLALSTFLGLGTLVLNAWPLAFFVILPIFGLKLKSFMTAEGQPAWAIITRSPNLGTLQVKSGRLFVEATPNIPFKRDQLKLAP